ncbi:amino acid adenylation domain-containing protein [Streptomyces sp. NPDC101151]|uniref:non-ribosomal peptide synthetase n=1 Tax=Streptomyces sp. NPDC101151 TaxID=3366115 RepID=UPI0037F183E6
MNASDLISEFESAGIRVWREGQQLRFRAPRGVMTDERLAALRGCKEDLLAGLPDRAAPAGESAAGPSRWSAEPTARHEPFPLTDVQSAYLLGRDEAFDYGGVSCHIYLEFRRPAGLDPQRLQQAWDGLVERHDMLRSVVSEDGTQRIVPTLPNTHIQVTDLRAADAAGVTDALAGLRDELSHKVHPAGERPMYELRLTRLADHSLLHLSMDFMVLDWISIQLLLSELDLRHRQPDCELPPVDATFRDYVAAERRLRDTERYARDRAYWWDRVDDLPAAPALPLADGHDPATVPPRFRRLGSSLSEEAWRALKARAAGHGITPANAVLAAYAETVGRWSSAERFCLGLTVLNRMPLHPHVDRLLGDFTSVSLLAVDRTDRAAFADRARSLGERLFDDLDHRLCSGVEVLREIARRRGREAALMPVVFTGGIGVVGRALGGAEGLRPVYGISQTPQVWIDCQATDQFGGLEVNWDVREGVFPDGMVDDMFAAFERLLHRMSEQDAPWTEADPLGLPERQRARRDAVNATAAPEPGGLLHAPLVAYARACPDETAVIDANGSMTYGEWLGRAAWVARELRAAGCRPGDSVAVLMDKGRDQVVGVLGVLLAGGVYVPVDIGQPQVRRDRILTGCRAHYAVLSDAGLARTLPPAVRPVDVAAAERLAPSAVPDENSVSSGDLAYVIHTSGSTGEPKGVMISHRAAANTVHDINRRFAVTDSDRVLGLAALGFDLSVYDLFGPPALGAALVLPDPARRSDPSHWAELTQRHGVTLWNSVPAQLQMLAHYLDAEPRTLSRVRLAMLSGDWIPLALPGHARRHLPEAELISLGGATEAAIWSIFHPIRSVEPHWRSIPYGTPLANQRFHILDSALRDRPDLVAGELYIAGTGLAEGYLHDPDRTAERFPPHPATGERLYRTGDLGRYLPDGAIEFLGRADQQVKVRGHRIELGEIDAVLGEHPAVGSSAVLVEGGDALERSLVAFVEPALRADTPQPSAVAAVVAEADVESAAPLLPGAPTAGQVAAYVDHLNHAFLLSMADAVAGSGLFEGEGEGEGQGQGQGQGAAPSADEVARRLGVAERHRGLLRRWLVALARSGHMRHEPATDTWRMLRTPARAEVDRAWDGLAAQAREEVCPPALLAYFRAHAVALPALLRGEQEAVRLFFPDGSQEIARAWYADNLAARRLLATLGAAVRGAAKGSQGRPLRVLEVGGGIGAATGPVLEALGDRPVDYLFTDVSEYFLADARERFGGRPGLRFGLFDMNRDLRSQGLLPNSFDVVLSAGALNNARDTAQVISRLRTLLAPQGWLCLLEMTREHPEITATQAFMMEEPEDLRREHGNLFVHEDQWRDLLMDAGAREVVSWPGPDDPFAALGQRVLAASFKQDRAPVDAEEITRWVAGRLPAYMVPAHLQVVDSLPLTSNGKVDRKRLLGWVPRRGERVAEQRAEPPRPGVERRVAELWTELLGGEPPAREQGFFEAGGDSLLAARLVGRVRESLPEAAAVTFDVLLRTLLHTPTVAGLAARLATQDDRAAGTGERREALAGPPSALVELGGSGPGPVRLLVHEGLGTLAPYRPLIKELAADGRLLGLAVQDSARYLELAPHRLVEDLAAQYAREVLAAGHRELEVVGYCSGGLIAAELARALSEGGADVRRLTVVSSYRIPYRLHDELMVDYAFARVMGGDLAALGWPAHEGDMGRALAAALARSPKALEPGAFALLGGDEQLESVAERFRLLGERATEERQDALCRALADTDAGLGDAGQVAALHRVFERTVQAVTHYEPLPYAGDITFLRPLAPTHFIPGFQDDMTRFWRELCLGELTVVDVPGDHFTCIQAPHVAQTAAAITARAGAER